MLLLLLSCVSRVRLCATPIVGSPPGSPVPGILQARILEWDAISFSNAWKWKVKVKSLSRVRLFVTPWAAVHQAPPPMGFFQARVLEWGAIAFSIITVHPKKKRAVNITNKIFWPDLNLDHNTFIHILFWELGQIITLSFKRDWVYKFKSLCL